jgi:hypothetical protein
MVMLALPVCAAAFYFLLRSPSAPSPPPDVHKLPPAAVREDLTTWTGRALAVTRAFHAVYTPCWEGAYGAIGDAYLFALTGDSSLLRFHVVEHDLRKMCDGTWVDDEAWVCLAELRWWEMTGRRDMGLVMDAARRYREMRAQGRLSHHEGFWTWYNWPPGARDNERIFTNSNMNQMATVACGLFQATGEKEFLKDALLVWNGDGTMPGIRQRWYKGKNSRGMAWGACRSPPRSSGRPVKPSTAQSPSPRPGECSILRQAGWTPPGSIRSAWTGTGRS